MKNTYAVSYKKLSIPCVKQILTAIEKILRKYNKKFFLIGALARDIILELIHERSVYRSTMDIDIAVLLSNWNQYDKIMHALIDSEGFSKTKEKHRLVYSHQTDRVVVDIIPVGDISKPADVITWPPGYEVVMTTIGFDEVYKNAIVIKFNGDLEIKCASLEGLTILKLAAWCDRQREKDAVDLKIILINYFDIYSEEIYEKHFSLIQDPNFDYEKCGARVLGRKIKEIIKDNPRLKGKSVSLLKKETADIDNSRLSLGMRKVFPILRDDDYKANYELLEQLLLGIEEDE